MWGLSNNGRFSVETVYDKLTKAKIVGGMQISYSTIRGMWRDLLPHKIVIFGWLAILDRVKIKGRLARIGIIGNNELKCTLYQECEESSNRLFVHCKYTYFIWVKWSYIWDYQWFPL